MEFPPCHECKSNLLLNTFPSQLVFRASLEKSRSFSKREVASLSIRPSLWQPTRQEYLFPSTGRRNLRQMQRVKWAKLFPSLKYPVLNLLSGTSTFQSCQFEVRLVEVFCCSAFVRFHNRSCPYELHSLAIAVTRNVSLFSCTSLSYTGLLYDR